MIGNASIQPKCGWSVKSVWASVDISPIGISSLRLDVRGYLSKAQGSVCLSDGAVRLRLPTVALKFDHQIVELLERHVGCEKRCGFHFSVGKKHDAVSRMA